jgi:hypothetical protein
MLILKPVGSGNWAPVHLVVEGRHVTPLLVHIGDRLVLGGVTLRVCEVRA